MKIVIDIDKEHYERIMRIEEGVTVYPTTLALYEAVKNGTPLEQHRNITNEEMYQQLTHLEAENERLHDALEAQPILDTRQRERQLEMEYQHGYDKGWEEGRKTLEQQTTDAVEGTRDCKTCIHSDKGNCTGSEECHECMWESKYEQQPCEDCISRAEAINVVHKYFVDYLKLNDDICLDGIRSLSPVTPQKPKTGHWIDTGSGQECSECGEIQYGYDTFRFFCANCGAKMGGDSE